MSLFSRSIVFVTSLVLSGSGCVLSHLNHDEISPDSVELWGYAQHPEATVRVHAYNKLTGAYTQVGTARSAGDDGFSQLHPWEVDLDLSPSGMASLGIDDWECYWGSLYRDGPRWACRSGAEAPRPGWDSIKLWLREDGSSVSYLTTFDEAPIGSGEPSERDCAYAEVSAGESWIDAGLNCRGGSYSRLVLDVAD
jgi:hypothetical protein